MTKTLSGLIAIIFGVVITLLAIWAMPIYSIVPRGIVLPAEGNQAATREAISLYDPINSPFNAKTIGFLTLMYYTQTNDSKAQRIFSESLAQLVNQAGGNGLQILQSFYIPPGTPSGGVNILKGKVILYKS